VKFLMGVCLGFFVCVGCSAKLGGLEIALGDGSVRSGCTGVTSSECETVTEGAKLSAGFSDMVVDGLEAAVGFVRGPAPTPTHFTIEGGTITQLEE